MLVSKCDLGILKVRIFETIETILLNVCFVTSATSSEKEMPYI